MIDLNYIKSKLKIFCLLIIFSNTCISQNELVNNGGNITVQPGGLIFVQGEVINTDNGTNIGLISNTGTVALSGNWTNNSTSSALTPTSGVVELNGALQLIGGTTPTTFNNLTLLGTNIKRLNINTIVGGTAGILNLTARTLDLNSDTLFVTNALSSAIIRTSGYILSETPATPGYGTIQWKLGNNTGNYEFPFGTAASTYIPFYYNISGAGSQTGIGSINASTYPTTTSVTVNNRPLPTGVNDLLNNCNTEHAKKMADRFWVINASNYGTTPTVIKKYTYVDDEWNTIAASTNTITESLLKAWYYSATGWKALTASTNNAASNLQTVTSNTNYGVFTLGEYRQLSIGLLNIDSVKCFGQNNGVIQFSTTPGYDVNTYNWNSVASTDTIKTDLLAGTYTIIATDDMGCADTLNNLTVPQPALLTETLTANDYSFCRNHTIQLSANFSGGTKPYTLNWSTGNTNTNLNNNSAALALTPTASIQYTTTLTDKNNCKAGDTIFVNVNQLPVVDFDADVKEGCQPLLVNFINISASSPKISSYQWNFFVGGNSIAVAPTMIFNNTGTYTVSVIATSDSGCVNSTHKDNFITVYEKPTADFLYTPKTDADLLNPKIDFQNSSSGNFVSSLWYFGDGDSLVETSPSHTYYQTGQYNVTLVVSTIHGCIDSTTELVIINDVPEVFIPNTFTPSNGDGLNDVFTVKGVNFTNFSMLIFDRWGEKILETTDPLQGWDGKYHGKECETGVYTYKVSLKFINGSQRGVSKLLTGHITLL